MPIVSFSPISFALIVLMAFINQVISVKNVIKAAKPAQKNQTQIASYVMNHT